MVPAKTWKVRTVYWCCGQQTGNDFATNCRPL